MVGDKDKTTNSVEIEAYLKPSWVLASTNNLVYIPLTTIILYHILFDIIILGAAVNVKMTCNSGHKESWASSRNVGQGKWTMPYINLLIILYSFMTGLGFDKLKVGKNIFIF